MNTRPRTLRSLRKLAAAGAVVAMLSACAPLPAPAPGPSGASAGYRTFTYDDLTVAEVATKLEAPWSVAFASLGSGTDVPLVSERDNARILQLLPDGGRRELARIDGVQTGGEGGLLGLAVNPEDQRQLYVYSTGADGNRVQRYTITGDGEQLSLSEPTTIIEKIPHGTVHNGGRIAFGPDKKLYISTGDAGRGHLAADKESLAGKILRVEADGSIPQDNPLDGSPVYSYGHRNVQGLAWTQRRQLYASEFGAGHADELNKIEAGKDYGWPAIEGMLIIDHETMPEPGPGPQEGPTNYRNPFYTWSPDIASPSGIAILDDVVYLANLRGRVLRSVDLQSGPIQIDDIMQDIGRLRDVVVTPQGKIWLLTNNTDGRGNPAEGDDRILELDPRALHTRHRSGD